jgi:hypothetical protein
MAKTTIVTLTDDLDGSKADRTVAFTWNGASYEIDLSRKNATAFEKTLAPYVDAARKVRGGSARGRSSATRSRTDLSAVRAWAKANGYDVSERGRIAATVVEAYNASK